uniref:Uncharacterized protein n=1 Tax=Desertifilum tharense IPPAS B-1220 TaxID=1781255 RepID=A0ACD5GVD1_9CYAN
MEYDADTDLAGNWVFRCLYLNPAGVEFLGDAAAAIGQPIRTLWRDRATEIELALKQVFHQGEQMFVSHQFVSGTLESLYIPIASPAGGVQRVLVHLSGCQRISPSMAISPGTKPSINGGESTQGRVYRHHQPRIKNAPNRHYGIFERSFD